MMDGEISLSNPHPEEVTDEDTLINTAWVQIYRCKLCKKIFLFKRQVWMHLKKDHPSEMMRHRAHKNSRHTSLLKHKDEMVTAMRDPPNIDEITLCNFDPNGKCLTIECVCVQDVFRESDFQQPCVQKSFVHDNLYQEANTDTGVNHATVQNQKLGVEISCVHEVSVKLGAKQASVQTLSTKNKCVQNSDRDVSGITHTSVQKSSGVKDNCVQEPEEVCVEQACVQNLGVQHKYFQESDGEPVVNQGSGLQVNNALRGQNTHLSLISDAILNIGKVSTKSDLTLNSSLTDQTKPAINDGGFGPNNQDVGLVKENTSAQHNVAVMENNIVPLQKRGENQIEENNNQNLTATESNIQEKRHAIEDTFLARCNGTSDDFGPISDDVQAGKGYLKEREIPPLSTLICRKNKDETLDIQEALEGAVNAHPNATVIVLSHQGSFKDESGTLQFKRSFQSNAIIPTAASLGIVSPFQKGDYKGNKVHKCVECGARYKSKELLTRHVNKKHFRVKKVLCEICGSALVTAYALKKHIQSKHSKGPNLRCEFCPYATTSSRRMENHRATHVSQIWCEVCEKRFSSEDRYNRHLQKPAHKRKVDPWVCGECGYTTSRHHNLLVHQRKHNRERPHCCKLCGYTSADSGTLKNHVMAKHTKIRPFKCDQCPFSTTQKKALTLHQSKHTGHRPFKCPHCSYATNRKYSLNKHLKTHKKPAPVTDCEQEVMGEDVSPMGTVTLDPRGSSIHSSPESSLDKGNKALQSSMNE